MHESHFLESETLIIELMLIATFVAIVAQRFRMPYTVALVIAGLIVSFGPPFGLDVTPELILGLFIPPLVFEAAFHIEFSTLKENLISILTLAVPGVILSTFIVGGVLSYGAGIPLNVALVFGALISATDPVAVVSLFRTLGVSHRLGMVVEGESLFNDGTAIVVFNLALAATLSGTFSLTTGLFSFLKVSFGGLIIGIVVGWIGAQLIARLDDYLIEITITTIVAYGAYLSAESFHVSGVLAVVAAGIANGNLGPKGMSPTTKIVLFNFWEYVAFLANSLVFLLIGLEINISQITSNIKPILVAVAAIIISRTIITYVLSWFVPRIGGYLPVSWRHVLFWGGLRGAISLALALSLPIDLPYRSQLQPMAYGVVLFTLLVQGTTIKTLLNKLGLTQKLKRRIARETRWGKLYAKRVGLQRLMHLREEGLLSGDLWAGLCEEYQEEDKMLADDLTSLFGEYPELERELIIQVRKEALKAEKSALGEIQRRGLLSEEVYTELLEEKDRRLEALNIIENENFK